MSSRSNGVTKLVLSWRMIRCVTESPACSRSRSCLAIASRLAFGSSNPARTSAESATFWPASVNIA